MIIKPKIPNTSYQLLHSGQSLFEAVLAIALIAIFMITVVSLSTTATRNSVASRNRTEANRYAQQAIEWLRFERDDKDYSILSSKIGITYCLEGLNWDLLGTCFASHEIGDTIFKRHVSFADDVSSNGVEATVVVTWSDGQGDHQVRNATIFTDWR